MSIFGKMKNHVEKIKRNEEKFLALQMFTIQVVVDQDFLNKKLKSFK